MWRSSATVAGGQSSSAAGAPFSGDRGAGGDVAATSDAAVDAAMAAPTASTPAAASSTPPTASGDNILNSLAVSAETLAVLARLDAEDEQHLASAATAATATATRTPSVPVHRYLRHPVQAPQQQQQQQAHQYQHHNPRPSASPGRRSGSGQHSHTVLERVVAQQQGIQASLKELVQLATGYIVAAHTDRTRLSAASSPDAATALVDRLLKESRAVRDHVSDIASRHDIATATMNRELGDHIHYIRTHGAAAHEVPPPP